MELQILAIAELFVVLLEELNNIQWKIFDCPQMNWIMGGFPKLWPNVKGPLVISSALKHYMCREEGWLPCCCPYAIALYKQHLTKHVEQQIIHISSQQTYLKIPDRSLSNSTVACFVEDVKQTNWDFAGWWPNQLLSCCYLFYFVLRF